ncbi:N-formylglutamate amidohydrolase [Pseudooceanicola onchidii]|uniref:N-formylglutamate amidohydrolase n=1 Tax=Pseudooceanicola onchidii TaxID=2562279 RepID=UPI0010AB4A84|nr:N-formylglutamate amidohydrolase [Pseudooceanicola onchidii]
MHSDAHSAEIIRADGAGPIVFACDHASCAIPAGYDGLGLSEDARRSHAAWDIGARDLALALSDAFDAPLVASRVSRLVYDVNRPLESPTAIPEKSEIFDVPGNHGLSDADRQARFDSCHAPFHSAISDVLDARDDAPAFVTIHSFTPVYNGVRRDVEIGYLHDQGDALARAALEAEQAAGRYRAALNEPYAASDGVTHTLRLHGEARGLPTLMIEVRNDLIDTPDTAREMATHLAEVLRQSLKSIAQPKEKSA